MEERLLRCEVLWWLLWGCFHSPSVPSAPPHPVLYKVRGWDSFPGGMSLQCRSSACFGNSLSKEVIPSQGSVWGFSMQRGNEIHNPAHPDACSLSFTRIGCSGWCSMQECHPGEELLLASAGLEGARPDPGAAVAWSTVTAPEQGTLWLQPRSCTLQKAPFWGSSNSRLSFLSPCS